MTNPAKYFNSFDPDKNYVEIMALAGRAPQSQEFNGIQALFRDLLKRLGNSLFRNGALISGGSFARSASNANQLTLAEAVVWYDGIMHTIPSGTVTLTGAGQETVGVVFTEAIITELEDPDLKDPATGERNFGKPGALRRKLTGVWAANNSNAVVIYQFENGLQREAVIPGEVNLMTDIMARRDYELSGDFVINGFDLRVESLNDSQVALKVGNYSSMDADGSKARVRGYEVTKLLPEVIPVDKALSTRAISGERFTYAPADPENPTASEMRFELGFQPGAAVSRVEAVFEVSRTVLSHTANGFDEFPLQAGESLVDIVSVAGFTKGTSAASTTGDFYKQGQGLNWNTAKTPDTEPAGGASYTVVGKVNRVLMAAEHHLYTDPTTKKVSLDISDLATKPASGEPVDVDYTFYLGRYDVVYVNSEGEFGILKGTPDRKPQIPNALPVGVLSIGYVYLAPGAGADEAKTFSFDNKRQTQADLRRMLRRLERTEYNAGAKNLENNAVQRGNNVANLRGIFTESMTYIAEDLQAGVSGNLKFDANLSTAGMINPAERTLTLPEFKLNGGVHYALTPLMTSATTAAVNEQSIALGYDRATNVVPLPAYGQTKATRTIGLNELQNLSRHEIIEVFPTEYTSIEEVTDFTALVAGQETTAGLVQRTNYSEASETDLQFNIDKVQFSETAKSYMNPSQVITVRGYNYAPNSKVSLTLDGIRINSLTGTLDTSKLPASWPLSTASTIEGGGTHVVANAAGEWVVQFTIGDLNTALGSKILTGNKVILATSNSGIPASASIVAKGIATRTQSAKAMVDILKQAVTPPPPICIDLQASPASLASAGNVTFTALFDQLKSGRVTKATFRIEDVNGTKPDVVVTRPATEDIENLQTTIALTNSSNIWITAEGPGGFSETKMVTVLVAGVPVGVKPVVELTPTKSVNGNVATLNWTVKNPASVSKIVITAQGGMCCGSFPNFSNRPAGSTISGNGKILTISSGDALTAGTLSFYAGPCYNANGISFNVVAYGATGFSSYQKVV